MLAMDALSAWEDDAAVAFQLDGFGLLGLYGQRLKKEPAF